MSDRTFGLIMKWCVGVIFMSFLYRKDMSPGLSAVLVVSAIVMGAYLLLEMYLNAKVAIREAELEKESTQIEEFKAEFDHELTQVKEAHKKDIEDLKKAINIVMNRDGFKLR